MKYTPDDITFLQPNQVFVFGSNTRGIHRKGAAETARVKFGAIYGQARGLQGQSYAIVTKDLALGERSIPLEEIARQVDELLQFATAHPDLEFLVTKIGCGLGGFTIREIASCFYGKEIPSNVVLPQEFWRFI